MPSLHTDEISVCTSVNTLHKLQAVCTYVCHLSSGNKRVVVSKIVKSTGDINSTAFVFTSLLNIISACLESEVLRNVPDKYHL